MNRKWVVAALALAGWGSEWALYAKDGLVIAPIVPGLCKLSLEIGRVYFARWQDGRVVLVNAWDERVPLSALDLPPDAARALASTLFDRSKEG